MREIKFRAWDKKNKAMESPGAWMAVELSGQLISTYGPYRANRLDKNQYILMQFTSLHDKNGKEIYEGDILEQAVPLRDRYIDKGVVEFSEGFFIIKANSEKHQIVSDWIRIIGNIYENPELLKGA